MNQVKTIATIITYNPDIQEIKVNIDAILSQVDELLILDNDSDNIKQIEHFITLDKKITLIKNNTNEGVAKAFNQAIRYCENNGYEYLLTLDQDTKVPSNLISTFQEYAKKDDKVAIICPYLIDININKNTNYQFNISNEVDFVKECISSGSYIDVGICKKVGYFDEKMFIDWVDFEYCKRVSINGYKIMRVNSLKILHQVGKAEKVKFFGREEVIYNHNPIRKYYYFRNRIYYARKYRMTILKDFKYFRNLIKNFLLVFKEKNRTKKIGAALKGIIDGIQI